MTAKYNAVILHEIIAKQTDLQKEPEQSFEDIGIDAFKTILDHGVPCSSVSSAISSKDSTNSGIILSFDDGHKSDIEIVLPMLQKKGFNATFFIVPKFIGKKKFLNWDDIRTLHSAGMEIGSHSMTHPDFRTLTHSQAEEELNKSKQIIQSKINSPVISFAFPFGFSPRQFIPLAKKIGYKNIMGSHHGIISGSSNSILPRNSIHGRMSDQQIKHLLDSPRTLKFYWFLENTLKPLLKKVLSQGAYRQFRNFLLNNQKDI